MVEGRGLIGLASRFGLAGAVTTLAGFAVIAGLDVGLHVAPPLANAAGYVVGVPLGFALNRSFVFRHAGAMAPTALKYAAAIALGFGLNQLVLRLAGAALGPGAIQHLAAQLAAMATYTAANFLTFRSWVFRSSQT